MAYIVPADFRTPTIQSWTVGLDLSTAEASDATLTAAIAEAAERVDQRTDDHFETETGITLTVAGDGTSRLYLPRRIQSVTSVSLRQADTTYSAVAATTYHVVSSISGSTVDVNRSDYLEALSSLYGWGAYGAWPRGGSAVQVVGNFSWPTTPSAIKRATAILVWKRIKAFDSYNEESGPTGDTELSDILDAYSRRHLLIR